MISMVLFVHLNEDKFRDLKDMKQLKTNRHNVLDR